MKIIANQFCYQEPNKRNSSQNFCVEMLKLDGEVTEAQAELDAAEKSLDDQSKLVGRLKVRLLDLTEKTVALQREWRHEH